MAKVKGPCNNCGGNKYAPDCPHPCDEAKFKKAKEEHTACKGGGGCGSGRDGGRQGGHKKWRNDKKDGDINDYGNGVQKRLNDWMCYCRRKECGWNTTHTSVFHAAWKRDTDTFDLPDDHNYCNL